MSECFLDTSSLYTGEDEKERKKRIKAEEAMRKWEDHKEPDQKPDAKSIVFIEVTIGALFLINLP